jgi:hypothetical protein
MGANDGACSRLNDRWTKACDRTDRICEHRTITLIVLGDSIFPANPIHVGFRDFLADSEHFSGSSLGKALADEIDDLEFSTS